jgi:serine/threonine protein kinase
MDIYAGGVMLFEMATLVLPIEPKAGDHGPFAWRNAHLLSAPKDVRSLRADLPVEIVQLLVEMLQKDPNRRPRSWSDVANRIRRTSTAPQGPDVSALVDRATSTLIKASADAVRAREEKERREERKALLELAFKEPIDVLHSVVAAFNSASSVGRLTLHDTSPLSVKVEAQPGHPRLHVVAETVSDLDMGRQGSARIIAVAYLQPQPAARSHDEFFSDRGSFGGFNLVYRVRDASQRFGSWAQLRFESNPLTRERRFPRWFAIGLPDLPRELQLLDAMGRHQHEQRELDDEWFKALLVQQL